MKFNKWTIGLAAVGVVSLASAAKAEEKANMVQTALSSTSLSGYVDTSAQWNFGTGNDWKVGVFDSIIGYESVESPNNPNYTRSYGHSIEPQTHTGVLASYRFCDMFSASVGIANTVNSAINSRAQTGSVAGGANPYAESYKSYMGSVAITVPDSLGFLAGSTFYGGVVNGYNNSVLGSGVGMPVLNAYLGGTIATPVAGLRVGAAWDLLSVDNSTVLPGHTKLEGDIWSLAGYA